MTDQELLDAQAQLNELQTKHNELSVLISDGNSAARQLNQTVRKYMADRNSVDATLNALRQKVKLELVTREAEKKRVAAEAVAAAAAAKAAQAPEERL